MTTVTAAPETIIERWLALFDRRWPTPDEVRAALAPDVRFVERPNLINPKGSERDLDAMIAGSQAGPAVLAWQRYEPLGHVVAGDVIVTRMRWSGELAVDAGSWTAGTVLRAWCVAHYTLRNGRIAHIEQHDCYEP